MLDKMKNFIAVVENKSINQAARQLDVSPQYLRASLNSFEQILGFPVLNRDHKGISLTQEGEFILDEVKEIIAIMDSWSRFKRGNLDSEITIKVASNYSIANYIMSPFRGIIKKEKRNITLDIYASSLEECVKYALTNKIIMVLHIVDFDYNDISSMLKEKNYYIEKNLDCEQMVAINAAHHLGKASCIPLSELKNFTFILTRYMNRFPFREIEAYTRPSYERVANMESVINVIAQDKQFAGFVPKIIKEYFDQLKFTSIKILPVEKHRYFAGVYLVYPHGGPHSVVERWFVERIRKFIQETF